jgi:hypothetical protein
MDMLRYDHSHVATPEDTKWVEIAARKNFLNKDDTVELMLETFLPPSIRQGAVKEGLIPQLERWKSFGWEVTEVYKVERIPWEEVPEVWRPTIR